MKPGGRRRLNCAAGRGRLAGTGSAGGRRLAALLIVAGCVLAPVSVLAVWTANQVSDTSKYVANVAPLIKDPAIQNALRGYAAIFLFGFLEACCVPIPSGITFGFAGAIAGEGHLNIVGVIVPNSLVRWSPTAWGGSGSGRSCTGSAATC